MLLHPVLAAVPREGIILGKAPKGHLSPKGIPSSSDMTLSEKQVSSCERDRWKTKNGEQDGPGEGGLSKTFSFT